MPSTDLRTTITAVLLAAAIVVTAWLGLRHRSAVLVLVMLSFVWLTVDRLWEGPVLIKFTRHTGVVLADLVGLLGFLAAAALAVKHHRASRRRSTAAHPPTG